MNPSATMLPRGPASPNATAYGSAKGRLASMQGGGPKSGLMGMGLLIGVPWITFTLVSLLFALLYHSMALVVWAFLATILVMACLLFVLDQRNRFGGKWYSKLGALTLFAALASTYLGLHNYHNNFAYYWSYEQNVHYTNVLPSESAAAHADGGKMLFTIDSRVDVAKSVGYKSSQVYCVAPVVDYATTQIEYWAVGINCCAPRGAFSCGDVWNPKARSAVLMLDADSAFNNDMKNFKRAADMAAAEWHLTQSQNPLFVKWVVDATAAAKDYWKGGLGNCVVAVSLYLLVSVLAGVMVQMSTKRTNAPLSSMGAAGPMGTAASPAVATNMGGVTGSAAPNTAGGSKLRLPPV